MRAMSEHAGTTSFPETMNSSKDVLLNAMPSDNGTTGLKGLPP